MLTPPENKGAWPPPDEPRVKRGICEYCDFPQEVTLRRLVVHGTLYWACDMCRVLASAMDETEE